MNKLRLRYDARGDTLTLRPVIDGVDLLGDYRNDVGLDPHRVLPPLSSVLLPTREGALAILGACSCGETGCGALVARVARAGSDVTWTPATGAGNGETLSRSYRFDLEHYLEAIDDAIGDPPWDEGRGRRVVRMVRQARGQYEQRYGAAVSSRRATIDWVSAWPWTSDIVRVSRTMNGPQQIIEFSARLGETEDQFSRRVLEEVQQLELGQP